jgi:hypothetical protein
MIKDMDSIISCGIPILRDPYISQQSGLAQAASTSIFECISHGGAEQD